MYRTKSGAVRLQVVLAPNEYRSLQREARMYGFSVSRYVRGVLFPETKTEHGRYQPRGFAKRKGA